MTTAGQFCISSVEDFNSCSPILVDFEFGLNPTFVTKEGLNSAVYVDEKDHQRRTVIVEKHDKRFVGSTGTDELDQTLILVRNKKTNKIKVYAAQSCHLVDSIKNEENQNSKRSKEGNDLNSSENWTTQRSNLNELFGSKKAKRASRLYMKLNADSLADAEKLKEAVEGTSVNLSEVNTTNLGVDDLMKLLPACNRKASTVGDVYTVKSLLNEDVMDTLRPAAEFLMANPPSKSDEKNSYFLFTYYNRLGTNPNLQKVMLLLYGHSLVKFFNMPINEIRKNDSLQKICIQSRKVAIAILNEFTVSLNKSRTRPSFCKDKLVCYLLVTILLTFDYEVDIEVLSTCLKGFGLAKLKKLVRVVGLSAKKGDNKLYCLKLPLPALPQVRAPKRNPFSLT